MPRTDIISGNAAMPRNAVNTVSDIGNLGYGIYKVPESFTKAKELATQVYPRMIHEQVEAQEQLMAQLHHEGALPEHLDQLFALHEHLRRLDRVAPRAEGEPALKRQLFHASASSVSTAFVELAKSIGGESPSEAVTFGLVHVETGADKLSVANLDRFNSAGKVVKAPFGIGSKAAKSGSSSTGLASAIASAAGDATAAAGASQALAVFGTASPIGALVVGGFNLAYNTLRTVQRVKAGQALETQHNALPALRRHMSNESFEQLSESVKYRRKLNAVVGSTQTVKTAATSVSIVAAGLSLAGVTAPATATVAAVSGAVAGVAGQVADRAKTKEKNFNGTHASENAIAKPRANVIETVASNGLNATLSTVAADFKAQRLAVLKHKLNSLILHVLDSEDPRSPDTAEGRFEKVAALIDPKRWTPGSKGVFNGTTMRPSDIKQINATFDQDYDAETLSGSVDDVRGRLLDELTQGAEIQSLQHDMAKKINKDWLHRLDDIKDEPAVHDFLKSLGFLKRKPITEDAIAHVRSASSRADAAYRSSVMTVMTAQLKTDAKYERVQQSNLLLQLARAEMNMDVISTAL